MFTLVAVATLALGIGANTAIYSVVHAVALQALPYENADRLIRVWEKNDKLRIPRFAVSVPNYVSWTERAQSFEQLGGWRGNSVTMTTGGEPQRLSRLEMTANVLPMLGVKPIAGRGFTQDEDRVGGPRVAMISESVWKSRLGGSDSVLGQPIVHRHRSQSPRQRDGDDHRARQRIPRVERQHPVRERVPLGDAAPQRLQHVRARQVAPHSGATVQPRGSLRSVDTTSCR